MTSSVARFTSILRSGFRELLATKVSLVRDVARPKRCAAFVSDVSIPHTWLSVDEFSNRLYWDEYALGGLVKFNIASLQPKNYSGATLAESIEEK